jgi:hypothetical protein
MPDLIDEDISNITNGKITRKRIFASNLKCKKRYVVIADFSTKKIVQGKDRHDNIGYSVMCNIVSLELDKEIFKEGVVEIIFPKISFAYMLHRAGINPLTENRELELDFTKKSSRWYDLNSYKDDDIFN